MSERDLWQEVLLCAINDARQDSSSWPIPESALGEAQDARNYLTKPSKDLAMVCSLAGIDMEALIDRMQKRLANAEPLPPLPAKEPQKPQASRAASHNQGKLLDHDGRSLTVKEWAEVTGMKAGTIHARLRSGWTVADALTVAHSETHQRRGQMNANRITHEGETLTYREWAERTGLLWFTIRERHKKGWLVEDVLRPGDLRGAHMRVEAARQFNHHPAKSLFLLCASA